MAEKIRPTVQVKVRMPIAFHNKLFREARRSGQTLNGEIMKRLEQSFLEPFKEVAERNLMEASDKFSELIRHVVRETLEELKHPQPDDGEDDNEATDTESKDDGQH